MAEIVTMKILDNTIISVAINSLKSIELMNVCNLKYPTITTDAVYQETTIGFPQELIDLKMKKIKIIDCSSNPIYQDLLPILTRRYPYLGKGELSILLLALSDFMMKGLPYYMVSDDKRFRDKVDEIIKYARSRKDFSIPAVKIQLTGTIGLIKRLYQKGCISKEAMGKIICELEKSNLYLTPKLLDQLRLCIS